jgi:protein SCO1/2
MFRRAAFIACLMAPLWCIAPSSRSASSNGTVSPRASQVLSPPIYDHDQRIADTEGDRASDRFADVTLVTHDGRRVQFLRDLVRDRMVVINLTYTRCRGSCPATNSRIIRLRQLLAPQYADRIAFLSITVEPEYDTPEILAKFSQRFRKDEEGLPPWLFLTGEPKDIEELRYSLGLFDPDPEVDADRTRHAALLTFGNDRTNRWAAIPAATDAEELARTIARIVGNTNNQRYAQLYSPLPSP